MRLSLLPDRSNPAARTHRAASGLCLACLLWAMGTKAAGAPPQTHDAVDLDRYAGTWYEIAKLPNPFQRDCAGDATADYERLADGRIRVVNRCREASGALIEAQGTARVVEPATNAKLEVSFVRLFGRHLFWGDYWILDIGEDYGYAVVGVPSRRYAWILAREPGLSPATRQRIDRVLIRAGYRPNDLVETHHGKP
jgi:apolipoprotein D and lipocalin family protein